MKNTCSNTKNTIDCLEGKEISKVKLYKGDDKFCSEVRIKLTDGNMLVLKNHLNFSHKGIEPRIKYSVEPEYQGIKLNIIYEGDDV